MAVHSFRIVSERPATVGAAIPVGGHLAEVDVLDGLGDSSVSVQADATTTPTGGGAGVGVGLDLRQCESYPWHRQGILVVSFIIESNVF